MTDSVANNTIIKYSSIDETIEETTIEELFEKCSEYQEWIRNDKHYAWNPNIKLIHYNPETDSIEYGDFNYVYKHKTSKEKWEIISETGESIIVTEDHSCMVERNNILIKVKPHEILDTDILISLD